MNTENLYILSPAFSARVKRAADAAFALTDGAVRFEEYIALPCFGSVILRFGLCAERTSLDALDGYERLLYGIVGDEFLIDFMGSDYRKAGVCFSDMEERFLRLEERFENEPVPPSRHAEGIAEDARALLALAGLPPELPVWEIQPEEDELLLLVMGERNAFMGSFGGRPELKAAEVNGRACTGLIKAAFFARNNGISIARILCGD